MAGRDSWFRCSCEVWDELIALYTIVADAPLPRELAQMDVRRHAHNPQSERDYAARWGWHRSKVRRLIKAGEWRDPYAKKQSESHPTQTRPTTDPQATQSRPTPHRLNADNQGQTGPSPTQTRPTTDPDPTHPQNETAREPAPVAEPQAPPEPPISISISMPISENNEPKKRKKAKPDPAFDMVVDFWKSRKPQGARPEKGRGAGRKITARLKKHKPEEVIAVLAWALDSEHERAQFLRAGHHANLATLLSVGKFETYLEMSKEAPAPARGDWAAYDDEDPADLFR